MLNRVFLTATILALTGCGNRFIGENGGDGKRVQKSFDKMSPYEVNGKWYYPANREVGEKITGIVSWYGDDYHGKDTANGEKFNMYSNSAAHKTLPMNTMLYVKNLSNGKGVVVRVNDRGPFIDNRELDLSKKAGTEIDIIRVGTTKAEITVLGYNGMIDDDILRNAQFGEFKLPNQQFEVKEEDKSSKIEVETLKTSIVQNTFSGTNIIEDAIFIEKNTPKEANNRDESNKTLKSSIVADVKIAKISQENSNLLLEEVSENSLKDLNSSMQNKLIEELNSTSEPVKTVTNMVIEPQVIIPKEVVLQKRFYVQVASFKNEDGVDRFLSENRDLLQKPLSLISRQEGELHKIWVSGFENMDEAREFNNKKEFFASSFIVVRDERVGE